ncbi:MAG: hypothetical protein P1U77_10545 [Rubripirellula sp.]|jgi:hypothetical protein|nr:hypothetical protein [Rubripirellula sp.]
MTTKKSRKLIPGKLKLIPAAAISAAIFAILSLLGLLNFNPPSLNDADSTNVDADDQQSVASVSEQSVISTELLQGPTAPPEPAKDTAMAEPTPPLEELELVDVLIDGDDYLFAIGQRELDFVREPKTVLEIVNAATEIHGDESGVKIRITRTFAATAQAERTLLMALSEAGLSEDEIDQRRTLVER